jgi:hypothetical protein
MYGKDSAGASTGTEPLRVRHQMKKASDAFRGFAVDLLTKGMLQQRRDSSSGGGQPTIQPNFTEIKEFVQKKQRSRRNQQWAFLARLLISSRRLLQFPFL